MDPLFPELPEELSALSDEEVEQLLEEHQTAVDLIEAQDAEFVAELSGEQIVEQLELGVTQIKALRTEQEARIEATRAFQSRIAELASETRVAADDEDEGDGEDGDDGAVQDTTSEGEESAAAEVVAEADEDDADEVSEDSEAEVVEEEKVPVVAAASSKRSQSVALYRRPAPKPSVDRQGVVELERTRLVAAAGPAALHPGTELDRITFAEAVLSAAGRLGRPTKHVNGSEERYLLASAEFPFPEERRLLPTDIQGNNEKIRSIGSPFLGGTNNPFASSQSLTASGGLCAPLTPFYDIPDFAVTDRPVRDALPSFQAERGGVSVPSVSTIGAIESAITVIEEEEDALGGTFATKSCQDMTCATWTDVAVGIISHCREYGNLNARAWPEGIAHENNLTMAAHARTAEQRLLDRIKALSINVTTADVYSSTHDLIYAITRAAAGIRFRLRLGAGAPRLRALLPAWVPGMLVADIAATQFDRFKSQAQTAQILRDAGIEPAFYLDDVTGGTSQGFADETASALDDFPDVIQWALFVEGEFLHLDGGVLELGIVRDSTLNSTNDYQVFGETFENVARVGPTQGALWVSSTVCPSGEFPALTTALSC